jgi:PmbA protein
MYDHKQAENAAIEVVSDLIERARDAGADAADAVLSRSAALSVSQRLGAREDLERAESDDLGLRVFLGQRQAFVSSSDLGAAALDELVARALDMAATALEDPHCGLAEASALATELPDLDLFDETEPPAEDLFGRAAAAEDTARAVTGVTNSEGAGASWSRGTVALAASNGFASAYTTSHHSISASVLAGEGTAMERDYDYAVSRFAADLEAAEAVGQRAGERAVRRLGPRKVATTEVPVVFDPRVADSLLRHLAGAVNGAAVARGTSFLRDRLQQPVFGEAISIIDDPHRRRGLKSRPCDGEGVVTRRRALVENGVLQTWLLDSSSARQLGLQTTGHASRGVGAPPSPSPSNLYLEPGALTPEELIADIENGFQVTELIGFGVNAVTGDYSRGAAGFWIENGAIAYPVSELTIAGNLKDMFGSLTAADDLVFRAGTDSPTVRIEGMTVAGA